MNSFTKRIMAGIICTMIAVSICGCSGGNAQSSASDSAASSGVTSTSESAASSDTEQASGKATEITDKIQADVKFPGMAPIGEDRMSGYYDVASDKLESFSAYICGSGAYPDEIAVFQLKSADDVADEMYKIDGNNVVTSGNYVALIICADNAKAIEDFNSIAK